MLRLSQSAQYVVLAVLVFLLVATRGHHVASLQNLPSASWAVFFLAGVYLRSALLLPALLLLAAGLDAIAIGWQGVSAYCVSPAYVCLLPAYSALWAGGRWFAGQYRWQWQTVPMLVSVLLGSAVVCELFSSGGFYLFSGHFAHPTVAEFAGRFVRYFPSYLLSLFGYVAVAAIVQVSMVPLMRAKEMSV